jgi:hypothetical protein
MDYPTILIKIAGGVLLVWTLRSIYKHFAPHKVKTATAPGSDKASIKTEHSPSVSEQFLNNLLLYLWLAFMLIFSSGMIFNN